MVKPVFEIVEHIGTLSQSEGSVRTELNLVAWCDRKPKYDIRPWKEGEEGREPYKGITLSVEELKALRELLNNMEL